MRHPRLRRLSSSLATVAAAPSTPLAAYKASELAPRTGLTHLFSRRSNQDLSAAQEVRRQCRAGLAGPTSGLAPGHVQASLVALPQEHAFDFLRFCLSNPRACPLLEVTEPGDPHPRLVAAASADVRTDLSRYLVWRDGEIADECGSITDVWREDMVCFLLGSSYSWDHLLHEASLTPRHLEQGHAVPMFRTTLPSMRSGPFGGRLVVSMRPLAPGQLMAVGEMTARHPGAHGGPVHWGDPAALGVPDLGAPDWGAATALREGELPCFWASGATALDALARAQLPLAITHAPGHLLVCDLTDSELQVPLDPTDATEIRACRPCTSRRTRLPYEPPREPRRSRRAAARQSPG